MPSGVWLALVVSGCGLLASTAHAQYRFDVWTAEQCLPQNWVLDIKQTADGYLWFTTFDGLMRYDGVRFTVFNTGNTRGLKGIRFSVRQLGSTLHSRHLREEWQAALGLRRNVG